MSTNDGYRVITGLTIISVKSICAVTFITIFLINYAVTLMLTWIWIARIIYYDTMLQCNVVLCDVLCNVVMFLTLMSNLGLTISSMFYLRATYQFRNHRQHVRLCNSRCSLLHLYHHLYTDHNRNTLYFHFCKYFLEQQVT